MPCAQPKCYPFCRAMLPYSSDEACSLGISRPRVAPALARSGPGSCRAAGNIGCVAHAGTRRVQCGIAHRAEGHRFTSRAQRSHLRGLHCSLVSRKRRYGFAAGLERRDLPPGSRPLFGALRHRPATPLQLLPSAAQRSLNPSFSCQSKFSGELLHFTR